MAKPKYYTLDNILSYDAHYNIIYGERSNGKTTAVLWHGIEEFIDSGYINDMAYIRRWDEDFSGYKGKQLFEGIVNLGWIEKKTKGKFNSVYYFSKRWYLCKYDSDGERVLTMEKPFCTGFALTGEEHYKSTPYPNITTILFDEFITRNTYLPGEFVTFQNLLSTIIRLRRNVKVFMCGNTINKYSPYFAEMGLMGVAKQKKGTIDIYTYGESELRVAVEYSEFPAKKKDSNVYFAFNNPKLQMITNGGWEIDIYPHLPNKYKPSDVQYHFYVVFEREIIQGNVIQQGDELFLFFHRKTTPIRDDNEQIVYQQNTHYKHNYRRNILKPYRKVDRIIKDLLSRDKAFYQDNEVGEIINNYLKWCKTH